MPGTIVNSISTSGDLSVEIVDAALAADQQATPAMAIDNNSAPATTNGVAADVTQAVQTSSSAVTVALKSTLSATANVFYPASTTSATLAASALSPAVIPAITPAVIPALMVSTSIAATGAVTGAGSSLIIPAGTIAAAIPTLASIIRAIQATEAHASTGILRTTGLTARPNPAPGSFRFSDLPLELRAKIYIEAAGDEPRSIAVTEEVTITHLPAFVVGNFTILSRVSLSTAFVITGATRPVIARTIKEAAQTLVKTKTYQALFKIRGTNNAAIYFNPEIDIIHIDSELPDFDFGPSRLFGRELSASSDLDKIKNLTMSLDLFESWTGWAAEHLKVLENLERLRLLGGIINDPRKFGDFFLLVLHFKRCFVVEDTLGADGRIVLRSQMLPFYAKNGVMYRGTNAMGRAIANIIDPVQKQRLCNLWMRICSMDENGVRVPPITLFADYAPGLGYSP